MGMFCYLRQRTPFQSSRGYMWGGLAVSDARKYSDFKVPCRYFKMLIKDWTYDNSTVNIETFIYIFLFYTNKIIKYLPTCLGGNKYIINVLLIVTGLSSLPPESD